MKVTKVNKTEVLFIPEVMRYLVNVGDVVVTVGVQFQSWLSSGGEGVLGEVTLARQNLQTLTLQ